MGFDDDIVSSTAVHLFLPDGSSSDTSLATASATTSATADYWDVDPRKAQLDLAGFLGENEAAAFASELWTMMLDAQASPSGIPRLLVEKKKEEMRLQREEMERKRKLQQQDSKIMRGERGAAAAATHNHHRRNDFHGEGNNKDNKNDMNAIVREAERRAEAARAAILPAAAAEAAGLGVAAAAAPAIGLSDRPAAGRNDDAAAVAFRGDRHPAVIIGESSGPVPVPPSPSPPRYYGGGGGGRSAGNVRGENYDHDRRRHHGDYFTGFSNYDQPRNDGGRRNNYYYNDFRSDYIDDRDVYRRDYDYYANRRGENGDFRGRNRGGRRWEDLDEFGRGRRDELGGGNNYPGDRDQRLEIGKSGDGTAKGRVTYTDNMLDNRKEPPLTENKRDKSSKQSSLGRADTQSGSGFDMDGSRGGRGGVVRPTGHSSRSASRSLSHRSSSRSSSARSRSPFSRSYSGSSSGSSSRSSRSRSYSLSRSRSRSVSSSLSHRSRDRDERKYKTLPRNGDSGVRSKRSASRSHSRDRQETNRARKRKGTEHSSSSYNDGSGSHGRDRHRQHHHHHNHHTVAKKDSNRREEDNERRRR